MLFKDIDPIFMLIKSFDGPSRVFGGRFFQKKLIPKMLRIPKRIVSRLVRCFSYIILSYFGVSKDKDNFVGGQQIVNMRTLLITPK